MSPTSNDPTPNATPLTDSSDNLTDPITDPIATIKKHLNRNMGGTMGLIIALAVLAFPYVKPKLDKLDAIDAKVESHDKIVTQDIPEIKANVGRMETHLNNTDSRLNEMATAINGIGARLGVPNRQVLADEPVVGIARK